MLITKETFLFWFKRPLPFIGVLAITVMACRSLVKIRSPRMDIPTPVAPTFTHVVSTMVALENSGEGATNPSFATEMPDNGLENSNTAESGWIEFQDDVFGLNTCYPPDWNGPEVHRWDSGVTAEIGTDVVYPMGTGLDARKYHVKDAYFISISYIERNMPGLSFDKFSAENSWIQIYTQLLNISDGESISDARNLTIRLGEVTLGDFHGLEYISTLSETAQTEIHYARKVLLFDDELNEISVTGTPNNVIILDSEEWFQAYQRVDAEYEGYFNQVLKCIHLE